MIFGLGNGRAERLRAALVFKNLNAVKPMLNVIALRNNHAAIPFAGTFKNLLRLLGRQNIVESRALAVAVSTLVGVGVEILQYLIFLGGVLVHTLVKEVFDT